jgi:hypothetical protein
LGLLSAGQYIEVGTSATLPGLLFTDTDVHIKNALAEGYTGYRVINCDKAFLSLFAGARWTYLQGVLSIFNNGDARSVILRELLGIRNGLDFSDSTGCVDPVIGLRGRARIWKAMSLFASGDVGDLMPTLVPLFNCTGRDERSCGNRGIAPIGATG